MDHRCKFGFGIGTIHPDMNSLFLVNDVFWEELQQEEEGWDDQAAKDIAKIKQINKYYVNKLNGEGISRIPFVEQKSWKTFSGLILLSEKYFRVKAKVFTLR